MLDVNMGHQGIHSSNNNEAINYIDYWINIWWISNKILLFYWTRQHAFPRNFRSWSVIHPYQALHQNFLEWKFFIRIMALPRDSGTSPCSVLYKGGGAERWRTEQSDWPVAWIRGSREGHLSAVGRARVGTDRRIYAKDWKIPNTTEKNRERRAAGTGFFFFKRSYL